MLKNDKKDTRTIITTSGILKIHRTVLRPVGKKSKSRLLQIDGVKSIAPLDAALGIDKLPFKMTKSMMCEVAFWAQNQSSFKATALAIQKAHNITVSFETIRKVSDYVGRIIFEEDTRIANEAYDSIVDIDLSNNKPGVLYIEMDGAMFNTITKDSNGSTWKENKLGMVFSSDNIRIRANPKGEQYSEILKKEYISYIGKVDEFKKHLLAVALKNGYGQYEKTVIVADGATWIRNLGKELFPDAIQILDYYHLKEHVYDYAKLYFKDKIEKYNPWVKEIMELIKTGRKDDALKIIEETKRPAKAADLYNYIINNYDKIDYDKYIEQGYFIGSGAIESGNKSVLQKRLKQAGMQWSETTAQHILTLRSKDESGLWNTEVVDKIINYLPQKNL